MDIHNKKGFASDNNAGVHPDIMSAIKEANKGHCKAYGDDPYTEKALRLFKAHFGKSSECFFVFTGTAANVLSIETAIEPFQAVICPETAHIHEDECGAPERFSGSKLLTLQTPDGKIGMNDVMKHMNNIGFEHHVQPGMVSITQATELGTVYSLEEISEMAMLAHKHNMYLHIDGARLANAAVSLNLDFYQLITEAGVDILSFGGTKNGMLNGEAVVILNRDLARNFKYKRKQAMQLSSKMRFIAAQFIAYFENDLWKKNAIHANNMAKLLADQVKNIPGVKITQEVQANGVFAEIPKDIIPILQKEYFFYIWNENKSEVRWMTSFDTSEEEIIDFVGLVRAHI